MKTKYLFIFMAIIILALAACSGPAATTASEAPSGASEAPGGASEAPEATTDPNAIVRGGTVIIGTPQEPGVLSPLLNSAYIEDSLSSFTIEGLYGVDAEGNYYPVLAEDFPQVSEDGLVLTYKLRQGIKFSNGDEFTCADMQFTFEALMSDLSGASTSGYRDIDTIECPDPYTMVVNFLDVYAPYMRLFAYVIPRAAGDIANLDNWEFNRKPIGTGPWIVSEWVSGDSITFVPNPYYREEGKPYLDKVIVKILPSREVGMQLLGTGEITTLWDITEADFPALEQMKDKGVRFAGAETGENELLLLNLADPTVDAPPSAADAPHPILGDLRVRQAIQYAIDKQAIVDSILFGNVRVGTSVLPASTGFFGCEAEPSEFNLDKANALLTDAGWVDSNNDGIREKDGKQMSLKITTTSGNQLREQTEQILVEMLKKAGIELVIENVPSDILFAGWDSNGMRKHGAFDILLYTTGYFLDPDSHLYSNYHTDNIPTAENEGAGSNYSRYSNELVDNNIDEAYSLMDQQARKELYCQAAAQINQDLPRIFLYERMILSGYRVELQNFQVSPGYQDFTIGSADWWLKK